MIPSSSNNKAIPLAIALVLLVGGVVFFTTTQMSPSIWKNVVTTTQSQHKDVAATQQEDIVTSSGRVADMPERVSLEGEYLCLPHTDTTGPQTMECAFGLKTADGTYYAMDTALMSAIPPVLKTGDRIRANGVLVPIERLSTDHWRKYPIKAIFSVTDSLQKL